MANSNLIAHLRKQQVLRNHLNWYSQNKFKFSNVSVLSNISFRAELESYHELYRLSCNDPQKFWGTLGHDRITWYKKFDSVLQGDFNNGNVSWFRNGKLNVSGLLYL